MSELGTPGKRLRFLEKCEIEAELMYKPEPSKSREKWKFIAESKELRRKAHAYDELMKAL